jgi:hypothetical protein
MEGLRRGPAAVLRWLTSREIALARLLRPRDHMAKPKRRDNGAPVDGGSTTATIDRDQLAQRAYELYLARGGEDGQDMEDWLNAERELRERNQSTTDH